MIQELLTDIELDVQQMKYMLDSISKEENPALRLLMKRMAQRMHEHLNQIQSELDSVPVEEKNAHVSSAIKEPVETEGAVLDAALSDISEDRQEEETAKEEALSVEEIPSSILEVMSPVVDATPPLVLGESIWTTSDFQRSISLNDSFRFTREIFGGDSELMNRVIEQISAMNTYSAAVVFLTSKVTVTEENEAMNDFLELLTKHFKSV